MDKRSFGRGILANKISVEINNLGRDILCLRDNRTIKKGKKHIVVRNKRGVVKARFCCRNCQQWYEHKMLEESGFYD